jgi:hypothetical protein
MWWLVGFFVGNGLGRLSERHRWDEKYAILQKKLANCLAKKEIEEECK